VRRANASWANAAAEAAWSRTKGAGLVGRAAVSYQNISPEGGLFGGEAAGPGYRGPGRVARGGEPPGGFSDANKSTTNVAWLVGSSRREEADHHIDIRDEGDLQPPSHLAVAPIPGPAPAPGPERGYMLARSKTVADLPCWADTQGSSPSSTPERGSSSESSERLYSKGPTSTATVSTLGSLRSKIVRHKTLLGSSSRLYKFSQSLSSLTTIASGDSRSSSLSRDPGSPLHSAR
jgi:hypothetical protein